MDAHYTGHLPITAKCAKCFADLCVESVDAEDGEVCVTVDLCAKCRMDAQTEEMIGMREGARAQLCKLQKQIADLELERDEMNRQVSGAGRLRRPGEIDE